MPELRIERLYPGPYSKVSLEGLYLREENHRRGTAGAPFVYANFLTSLDGRIAVQNTEGEMVLPSSLTNPVDFRLFLELHAQADGLITHGAYMRALERGALGNILRVGNHPLGLDLPDWRAKVGLSPQPTVVVTSRTLDFPDPKPWLAPGQNCVMVSSSKVPPKVLERWRDLGYEVFSAGDQGPLEGEALTALLAQKGLRSVYLIAGPRMLETMIRCRRLAVLYHTMSHQLLGGELFRTLIDGPDLGSAGQLQLEALYQERASKKRTGQWFAKFALSYD